MTPSQLAAGRYLENGWAVVPLSPEEKRPIHEDWPTRAAQGDFTQADFEGFNVGVVLGHVSGHLTDVDLDSEAALALAPYFLAPTATFGRASKPASHWLYYAEGCKSCKFWFTTDEGRELVELRATNASNDECGHQTAFPGSTHPSGELVEWTCEDGTEIVSIKAGDLLWDACRLTVACIVIQRYSEGNSRNAQTLGLAGGLLKAGWTADEVTQLFDAVRECSGDDREKDRSAVERTIEAFANGEEVTGFGSLLEDQVLPEQTLAEIQKHARTPETRAKEAMLAASKTLGGKYRDQYLADARETDGMLAASRLVQPSAPATLAQSVGAEGEHPTAQLKIYQYGEPVDFSKTPEPLSYLWGPFAPGKVSAIGGFANAGKSPFLESLLLHSALGKPAFCELPMSKQRCGLLDFETGRLAEIRMHRLARGMGLERPPLDELLFLHMRAKLDEHVLEAVDEWVRAFDIGVLGIDTYGAAIGQLDHNSPEFSHWLKELGTLSNSLDVLVIVLMHEKKTIEGKRKGSPLEMLSGHNSAPGALQGVVSLWHPDEDDSSRVSVHCSRAPEESFNGFDIQWSDVPDPKSGVSSTSKALGAKWGLKADVVERLEGDAKKENLNKQIEAAMPKVLELLTAQANDGSKMAYTEVAQAITGRNAVIRMAIDALVKSGRVLGDYLVGQPPSRTRPRHVWLPRREKSEAGMIQP